jgi:hypothetical protein
MNRAWKTELVGVTEIAKRCKVSRAAVCNWIERYDAFPKPLTTLAMGPVFYWGDIVRWLKRTDRM